MSPRSHRLSRQIVAFLHDLIMAALSFVAAIALRLGLDQMPLESANLWLALGIFTAVCGAVFLSTGLYRGIWRYASLDDLIAIVRAVTLALLVFLAVTFLVTRLEAVPRSSLIINWLVLVALLGAPRMAYRVVKDRGLEHLLERQDHRKVPVLLIGAGNGAELFAREMARERGAPYEIVGILDDKGTRVGRRIHGVPVLTTLDDLTRVLERLDESGRAPQRLIVTQRQEREVMERLLEAAESRGMSVARLPRLTELDDDGLGRLEPRPVALEDLLGRTRTKLDRAAMRRLIDGRRVLVTGAGGSIGSELVRQIAGLAPARLSLLDNSEFQLYSIGRELAAISPALPHGLLLGDVRERSRIDQIMVSEKPELVFHAAALKHVPMVEANVAEGVLTNTLGVRNVADACCAAGVAAMVLISTDKAVNPTSVMGASKRLAECYCQALDIRERDKGTPGTRYVTVRFGNVLGSTGSVVPLFQSQIAAGGPLTVTHPAMTRYFMTVDEAVELVLQASALGVESPPREAGKIYVLDMGEPVKVLDLARQMIRLAGLKPDEDIEIQIIGPRPGEKLHEELFHEGESLEGTYHPGLRLASPRTSNHELLSRSVAELADLCAARREDEIIRLLQHLVPEYWREAAGEAGFSALRET